MTISLSGLAFLFFIAAALYAAVGFGGGSTYIALLALSGVDYRLIPVIALTCNIIVVTGGTLRFQLRNLINWTRVWPLLALSVPAAWIGGLIAIDRDLFLLLLGGSLILAGLLLLAETWLRTARSKAVYRLTQRFWFLPFIGAAIGFLSGIVGIGGGIFLAPILLLANWADSRRVAATASVFILVNSISGLTGQLAKSGWGQGGWDLLSYWPLFAAVLLGGQIGSHLASRALPEIWIKRLTAVLVLYVALRIFWQQAG
ncbi:MAG: sulfite exporter TauE/SafE family protein [Pseudomonadota bacterium]